VNCIPKARISVYDDASRRETETIAFRSASIQFIKECKEYHGQEKTSNLINKLGEVLGREWSAQVIFDLLTEEETNVVTIRFTAFSTENAIPKIKALRSAAEISLKEAKDLIEDLHDKLAAIIFECQRKGVSLPRAHFLPFIELRVKMEDRNDALAALRYCNGLFII